MASTNDEMGGKREHNNHERLLPTAFVGEPSPKDASGELSQVKGAEEISGVVAQLLLIHLR